MNAMPDRIRFARTRVPMTQQDLARAAGVARSAVCQWERSRGTRPSTSHLERIALATGASFEWLSTGRGPWRANDYAPALRMDDFAQDDWESTILALVRRIPPRRRASVAAALEILLR
jgi:transcriptional regulator with XRE-family HTH domain